MIVNRIFKYISLVSLLLLLMACTKSSSMHEDSAKKLCDIYSPANLTKLKEGLMSDKAFYQRLGDEGRKVSNDSQFIAVFQKAFESGKPDFAVAIQDEVSILLGKAWECENMNKFYSMSFSVVEDAQNNTLPIIVTLKLSSDGLLSFNNKSYSFNNPKLWQKALQKFIIDKKGTDIEVFVPEGKYIDEMDPLLSLLSDIGISQRHIVIQEFIDQAH